MTLSLILSDHVAQELVEAAVNLVGLMLILIDFGLHSLAWQHLVSSHGIPIVTNELMREARATHLESSARSSIVRYRVAELRHAADGVRSILASHMRLRVNRGVCGHEALRRSIGGTIVRTWWLHRWILHLGGIAIRVRACEGSGRVQ